MTIKTGMHLTYGKQANAAVFGILFTMLIEGHLGRRNCLWFYTTLMFWIYLCTEVVMKAHRGVVSDCSKEDFLWKINLIMEFMISAVWALVSILTLTVYPASIRCVKLPSINEMAHYGTRGRG